MSWNKYDYYLSKSDIQSGNAGNFTLLFSTSTVTLNSSTVTVGVIGTSFG